MRKLVSVLIVVTMLFATGCSHWTDTDRLAFGFACAGQGADLWTTDRNFRVGFREEMLPWNDTGSQALFRVALLGGATLLGEAFPEQRAGFFIILGFGGVTGGIYNQIAYDDRP